MLYAILGLFACSSNNGDAPGATGANLSVDYFGDSDVIGFHFEVERVSCAGEAIAPFFAEANVNLADNIFPGMVEHVEEYVDPESKHLGADFFVALEPGCYDIVAVPASAFGAQPDEFTASADCATASVEGLVVSDGTTTEAPLLVSQCVGDPMGAGDTTVLLNHPPRVTLTIDEKYNYECETVEVCARYYDVDNDPMETSWDVDGVAAVYNVDIGDQVVVAFENGHRVWEQCAAITTRWTGAYEGLFEVWDLGYEGGSLVRFEDITDEASHDDMAFPIFTNWVEEPMCFDDAGNLVEADGVSIERYPGCDYTSAEEFYCSGDYDHMIDDVIEDLLCDGEDLLEEALYPVCD